LTEKERIFSLIKNASRQIQYLLLGGALRGLVETSIRKVEGSESAVLLMILPMLSD
jgi:hypothetical protein